MLFYGDQGENETETWTPMKTKLGFPHSTPSSVVESSDLLNAAATSLIFTGKAHSHHHHRHHHHLHNMENYTYNAITKRTQDLIDAAASMASGVIESATASSSSHEQYYEAEAAILATDVGSTGQTFASANLTMNESTNSSLIFMPVRDPLYITIPISVIYACILLVGLLGNIVTCYVIVRSRYLHTTTNYYLFSLAISDLLLLLSGLPVEMYSMWRRYPYVFGEYFCIGYYLEIFSPVVQNVGCLLVLYV